MIKQVDVYMQKIQKLWRATIVQARLNRLRILHWWVQKNMRYGTWWRVGNTAAALLMLFAAVAPVIQHVVDSRAYHLSADTLKLVGSTDTALSKQLTYDAKSQVYQFNKSAVPGDSDNPLAAMQAQVGKPTGKDSKNLYALDVSKDGSQGVRYYDTNSGLSFRLIPEYKTGAGKTVDGHLVYPLEGNSQAVYTLKNNGLKEDIILQEASKDTQAFRYKLDLPKTLEMRAIPNSGGAVGVYSANPSLFGDISYGSDSDRASVQKARENAEKSYLVFGLPSPVIKDTEGKSVGNAHFELTGNTLTVVASELSKLPMPVSIDPSVVVTSTTDFQYGGNDEGMINFNSTGNQITRGGITGGSVGNWSSANSLTNTVEKASSAVYNGYVYQFGGYKRTAPATYYSTVNYATLNSDGTLGTWMTTTSMPSLSTDQQTIAYSGYMYLLALGGATDTYYAHINSDGTLGSWVSTTSLPVRIASGASAVYNGYLYMLGGSTGNPATCGANGTCLNTSYYAPFNGDGTLGSWNTTTVLNRAEALAKAVAYNGYMYISGGGGSAVFKNVDYAPINADGTLGSWIAATDMTAARYGHGMYVYDGYMYVAAGYSGKSDVLYAQIYANGALGPWRATTSLSTGLTYITTATYNGYLYVMTGYNGTTDSNSVYYAKIKPAGQPSGFTTTATTFTTARALTCTVTYNGYIYAIGGSTTDSANQNVTTVQYSALNATTGQTGTWTATTVLPVATGTAGCVAYNGYIYLVGGYTGTGTGTLSNVVRAIPINANGSLGTWSTKSSTGLSALTAELFIYSAAGSTYLYALVIDGQSGGQNVMRATITTPTSGTISSWTGVDSSLPDLGSRAFAQVGDRLYAMGGKTAGTNSTAVYYTTIASDGTVPNWQTTTSLNTAISYSAGTTVNGCIYSVGGEDSSGTSLANVQYACPNTDGTISAWYDAPNLSVATTDMGVASYDGYIYGVGGYTTAAVGTTQFSYVNNGGSGSTGSWNTATNSFTSARMAHASVAYDGHLYVIGGYDGTSYRNDVQYATISSNGDVGSWADANTSSSFTTGRENLAVIAYAGYMYIIGGHYYLSGEHYMNDVQYAPINSDGTLGTWAATSSFGTARDAIGVAVYKGYVYITGGENGVTGFNDTQYAPINSDGTLGTWAATTSFVTARSDLGSVAYRGYLYVIGGWDGSVRLNDTQYAPINSDGTLGAWAATTSFVIGRSDQGTVVSNGFIYITGGYTGSTYLNDTQYAPINSDGTLGAWSLSVAGTGGTGRAYMPGVAYRGYLYILGGYDGTTGHNDVQYTPLNAFARIGHYSKLIDMGATVNIKSITYNGTLPNSIAPGVSPISYKPAASNGVFNPSMTYTNVPAGANGCDTTSTSYTRYLLVTVTLDDSSGGGTGGIFPDANGTNANLADITVTYTPVHATPDIRLRAGQSLQQGSLAPLDTCYP